jgi:hypothetical protein
VRKDRWADRQDEGNVCLLGVGERPQIASLLHIEPIDRRLYCHPVMLLVDIVIVLLELYLTFENAVCES